MLTQVALPVADVSSRGWAPTPVYPLINSTTPDDASWVSALAPGATFVVRLPAMARPITGPHTLTVRSRQVGPGVSQLTFFLLQGAILGPYVVAARSVLPAPGFTSYDLVLTEDEIDLILDYTNLLVMVVAAGGGGSYGSGSGGGPSGSGSGPSGSGSGPSGSGGSGSGSGPASGGSGGGNIFTPCCPGGLPPVLHFTFSGVTGCPALNGKSLAAQYDPEEQQWRAYVTSPICSETSNWDLFFYCTGGVLTLGVGPSGGICIASTIGPASSTNCNGPTYAVFSGVALTAACGGGACTISVTA